MMCSSPLPGEGERKKAGTARGDQHKKEKDLSHNTNGGAVKTSSEGRKRA